VGALIAAPANGAEYHVSPDGTPDGMGTSDRPWDLATALAPAASIQPGDSIWLHAGTYSGGFSSHLAGRPDTPIVVRGAPGERATIDTRPRDDRDNGLFHLAGADTIYRDFEVTCSDERRVTEESGSWPADIRRGNVDIRGDRISLVNLVVHDQATGFGFWSEGEGGEIYGCLIYHNGWQGPDRGHGHGIYLQNARGTKRITDNVVFHQFGYGIHAYGSERASLRGIEIEGNITFENGALSRDGHNASGIMVGGGCPATGIVIRDNVSVGGNIRLGYPWGTTNEDAVVTGNYCDWGLVVRDFRQATIAGNTFSAHSNVVQLEGAERLLLEGLQWDDNDLFVTDGRWGDCAIIENNASRGLSFSEWQQATGFDAGSRFTHGHPAEQRVVVRPNAYEPGRAHVAVLNPQLLPEVEVDLSGVLTSGQTFRVVSVKDFYGPSLVTGTYDGGAVRVPMSPVQGVMPVGMPDAELPVTEPGFAAYVVLADGPQP
jgi:hypothetical protein